MNWSERLKEQIRERAIAWTEDVNAKSYRSIGNPGTVMFPYHENQHGNFFPEVWDIITSNSEWFSRLNKPHSQRRHLPLEFRANAKELDSSNSSDALLMNFFCFPNAAQRLAPAFGATFVEPYPQFGVPGKIQLHNGSLDATELDMVLGDTIVEAKLTEQNFTFREKSHVSRYEAFEEIFEVELLPSIGNKYYGYQLIRNVLAAAQMNLRFAVLIDYRRPDLLKEWWSVHTAVKNCSLRSRCFVVFWQELAMVAKTKHRILLNKKYGF
ncbi:PGN_0703 family putative restriction endonuclease [Natronogracilivirga saccharolytica]|uniref:Restriction endonuclease n=1 Tax=Natronogracilivirga saccharolytica TaxID=2812953 RepID=A0A8J7SAL8_9BACT|nr:hypothetical protein [Natronogracilivirga saccharolytica]MBP3193061.1 hypothetical protein [Natronogracilivirga saccharolytica]